MSQVRLSFGPSPCLPRDGGAKLTVTFKSIQYRHVLTRNLVNPRSARTYGSQRSSPVKFYAGRLDRFEQRHHEDLESRAREGPHWS